MSSYKFLILVLFSVNIISVYSNSDQYIGCYVDASNRDLAQFQGDGYNVDTCIEKCKNEGYSYAGVQWFGQCFCDNDYGTHGQADCNDCNTPCSSNGTQICGGGWRNSVYSTSSQQSSQQETQEQTADGYIGCYVDFSQRDLTHFQGDNFNVDTCKQRCTENGYAYAAVQWYGQCFCDNDYGSQGQASESDCNTQCLSNPSQMCGGGWRNSIYRAQSDQVSVTYPEGYLGCFIDSSNRDLANQLGAVETVESCNQICANKGYRYAGSQYYGQCFCDVDFGAYGKVDDSECSTPCSSDNNQQCGGTWRNSVYDVSHLIEQTPKPEGYIGCYIDTENRDLPTALEGSDYTPTRCRQACADRGFKYAGIQYYGQCFCGQEYGTHGISDESECNTRCSADNSQLCGGTWRNEIFDATELIQVFDLGDNYKGCFNDAENRDLPNYIGNGFDLVSCQVECAKRGYFYSGSQYYGQCFCGDDFGAHGESEQSDCNTPCNSNTTQMCGGSWKNSVFSVVQLIEQDVYPIEYLGCYIDTQNRDLANYKGDGYTIEDCLNECIQNDFRYAGLQSYGQCYCDSDYGVHGQAVETDCNTPCDADVSQMCGGEWRNDIYDLSPQPRNSLSQYTYLGCYEDKEQRDLEVFLGDGFQVEQCLLQCFSQGYRYAGLQYHGQCFCDNDYGLYSEKPEEQCNSRCNSDPQTTCGGTWRNQVYTFGVAQDQQQQIVDPSTQCIKAYPECDFEGEAIEVCGTEPVFGPIMKSFEIPDGLSVKVYNQSVERFYEFSGNVECIFGGYKGVQINI